MRDTCGQREAGEPIQAGLGAAHSSERLVGRSFSSDGGPIPVPMWKRAAVSAFAILAAALIFASRTALAAPSCDLVASPSGSDAGAGTVAAPFRSVQKLVDSLQPGQTGCLRAGTYTEDVEISAGGLAGTPVTLTSYPGERATVMGRLWVAQGADYVTVTGLNLDGVNADNLPSPTINANYATFSYDDVTNAHTGICFDIGSDTYGVATGTLITHDRIHDCGALPATNHDHGIYVQTAVDTQIEWNLIYANADRGIQLYPDAQYTTIDHNVVTHNGEDLIFSGDGGQASSHSRVYDNLLTDAQIRHDVESWYPGGNPVGTDNLVWNNCIWGGAEGEIDTSGGGFTLGHNLLADPQYVAAALHDYSLLPTSPCLTLTGDVQAAVDGTTPSTVTFTSARSRQPRLAHCRRSSAKRPARACTRKSSRRDRDRADSARAGSARPRIQSW